MDTESTRKLARVCLLEWLEAVRPGVGVARLPSQENRWRRVGNSGYIKDDPQTRRADAPADDRKLTAQLSMKGLDRRPYGRFTCCTKKVKGKALRKAFGL